MKKTKSVTIRISDGEEKVLSDYSSKHGMGRSEVIRSLIIAGIQVHTEVNGGAPCDQQCQKCQSSDAYRRWIPAGIDVGRLNQTALTGHLRDTSGVTGRSSQDRIRHHCRCCGYEWDSTTNEGEA